MGVLCDPIFWVVCWLLVGSPTAVQLTQITQLNNVFEGEMATVFVPFFGRFADDRCYGGIMWCFVLP
jgi:hypothetical protein